LVILDFNIHVLCSLFFLLEKLLDSNTSKLIIPVLVNLIQEVFVVIVTLVIYIRNLKAAEFIEAINLFVVSYQVSAIFVISQGNL
jgi:hypothetical protein